MEILGSIAHSVQGSLIPPAEDIVDLLWKDEPGYVLVVEKEVTSDTTFRTGTMN